MLVSIMIAVSLVAGAHSACPGEGTSGGSTCNQAAAMAVVVICTSNSDCTSLVGTVCSNYALAFSKSCRISAETHLILFLDLFHSFET